MIPQKDKDLLLQDLCGRLPYGVKAYVKNWSKLERKWIEDVYVIKSVYPSSNNIFVSSNLGSVEIILGYSDYFIKPYLFPLSSMTEEQKKELNKKFHVIDIYGNSIRIHYHSQGYWDTDLEVDFQDWLWLINWLNKNHFDYNGLIEKGLAIDCTNLNIY